MSQNARPEVTQRVAPNAGYAVIDDVMPRARARCPGTWLALRYHRGVASRHRSPRPTVGRLTAPDLPFNGAHLEVGSGVFDVADEGVELSRERAISSASLTYSATHAPRKWISRRRLIGTVALDANEHNSGGHRWALDVPKLGHSPSSRAPGAPRSALAALWPPSTQQCPSNEAVTTTAFETKGTVALDATVPVELKLLPSDPPTPRS